LAPTFTWASYPAYKISKAALNSLTVQYSLDHAKDGFTFVAIAPGVSIEEDYLRCRT
jgi:NAD(P)-dependent dehydrogenase (short-subunit alcohol dehydrogenase family)